MSPRADDVAAGSRSHAWTALCALLALGALGGFLLPAAALDGQPGLWLRQPWRLWTAAFVHWSAPHLAANLAGVAVLLVYGRAAQAGPRQALAWLMAWPLTHLGLLDAPGLLRYGGLSGVLHAGVAVASTALLARRGRERMVGAAVWAGLLLKLGLEAAGPPGVAAWLGDFALATRAHAAGALAGLLCALAVEGHERQKNAP